MSKNKNSAIGQRLAGFASIGLALIAITPNNAFATPIPLGGGGVVNISNTAGTLLGVSSVPSPGCIAFSGNTATCNSTTADLVSSSDPQFLSTGTIKDFSSTPVIGFKTVNLVGGGAATWDILNVITPSGFPTCTPGFSGAVCATPTFILTQTSANQVSIALSLSEIGYLGSSLTGSTAYVGIFTTQLSGDLTAFGCTGTDTIANILTCEAGGGTIKSTWSGTESPVSGVPEPMTFSLMGVGLLGLGLISRRRKMS